MAQSDSGSVASDDYIFKSKYADVHIPDNVSLPDFLTANFARFGDRDALTDSKSGESYTFAQLARLFPLASRGFARLGVEFGDTVGTYMPNHLDFLIAFVGATRMGAVISPANPIYTGDELAFQLGTSGARWTLTVEASLPKVKEALLLLAARHTGAAPFRHHLILIGTSTDAVPGVLAQLVTDAPALANGALTASTFAELIAETDEGAAAVEVAVQRLREVGARAAVCCLPFSSGTTGLPKGVRLTHHSIVANLAQCTEYGTELAAPTPMLHFDEHTVLMGMLPFFHIFGLVVVLFGGLFRGSRVIVMAKFEPLPFLETLAKYKITTAALVPPVIVFLAKHPSVEQFVSQIVLREILSGAAPLDAALLEACKARLKLPVLRQGYGMTELSPVVTIEPSNALRAGCGGVLVPNTECKIVSDWGNGRAYRTSEVGDAFCGELCFRGPQVMDGYLNNAKATSEMIEPDGWLHTGDVGYIDADGYLFIVDRIKELIKVKGFQVAPAELEAILLTHAGIADAAVIGYAASSAEEEKVIAYVVLKDAQLTPEAVIAHVASHVAPHKQIKVVKIIAAIPKSASGKILRRVLRDQYKAEQ